MDRAIRVERQAHANGRLATAAHRLAEAHDMTDEAEALMSPGPATSDAEVRRLFQTEALADFLESLAEKSAAERPKKAGRRADDKKTGDDAGAAQKTGDE
jgi:hypothetical protein